MEPFIYSVEEAEQRGNMRMATNSRRARMRVGLRAAFLFVAVAIALVEVPPSAAQEAEPTEQALDAADDHHQRREHGAAAPAPDSDEQLTEPPNTPHVESADRSSEAHDVERGAAGDIETGVHGGDVGDDSTKAQGLNGADFDSSDGGEDRATHRDELSPAAGSSDQSETEPQQETRSAQPVVLISTILALLGILTLAYLAGHARVRKLEDLLGISQVVASGLPFFMLGAVAHLPQIGLLSDDILGRLTPLLEFGLGWIGLLAGLQFNVRRMDRWPVGIGRLAAGVTVIPFIVIASTTGALLYALEVPATSTRLFRDAVMLGAAGCLAAPTAKVLLSRSGLSKGSARLVRLVAVVDDVLGICILALLSAFYRPSSGGGTWVLPGIGWLFVTVGMGVSLALLAYLILRSVKTANEVTALLLGCVTLAAGSASFFSVSPIVTCFAVGLVLANLPGAFHEAMQAPSGRLERPIYLMFLVVAGALWRFEDWEGWVLLPAFVVARLAGRGLAVRIARARGTFAVRPDEERALGRAFVQAPMGALSIAMVVNVQTLYPGRAVPLMVTVVVGGALLSELLVQIGSRIGRAVVMVTTSTPPEQPSGHGE